MASSRRSGHPYVALLLVSAIIVVSVGSYLRWWDLGFHVASLLLAHWLAYMAAGYIAIFIPIYATLKRRSPRHVSTLLNIHVFGNLVAFLLISMHFAHHMGRPAEFAPTLGTGLTLYMILAIMVLTGLIQRYRLASRFLRTWRFVHVGLSLSFYIVLVMHILITLGKI